MITYTWQFPVLTAYPEVDGQANVVFIVHWRLRGSDETGHSAEAYGTTNCPLPLVHEPFTPFEELTSEQVQSWVESSMGSDQLSRFKASIESQIQEQIAPTQVNLTPPWGQVPLV